MTGAERASLANVLGNLRSFMVLDLAIIATARPYWPTAEADETRFISKLPRHTVLHRVALVMLHVFSTITSRKVRVAAQLGS